MPVYGVEAYIAHALECVQAQTYVDWELILVDDCSPDGSIAIAQGFAKEDDRIRIVRHSENQGLSAARNTGIKNARGAYVWVPDPDDWYEPDLLASAHAVIAGQDDGCAWPDALVFGYEEEYFDAEGAFLYEHEVSLPGELAGKVFAPRDWRRLIASMERSTHYGYAWNKMYRLSHIRESNLRFESVRLIEDIVFNVAFFQHAGNVAFLPELPSGLPYHYAKRQGKSLTNANEYGAREYYDLHHRRIQILRDQLVSWGVLDEQAKSILGSLYGRFIFSALERQCWPREQLSRAERRRWCRSVFADPLFQELIPCAKAGSSRALALCLKALKGRNATACLAMGRVIHFARENLYPLFTKMRSGR